MPGVRVKLPFTRKIKVSTRRSRKVSKLMREETFDMSQWVFWANCSQQDTADIQKRTMYFHTSYMLFCLWSVFSSLKLTHPAKSQSGGRF